MEEVSTGRSRELIIQAEGANNTEFLTCTRNRKIVSVARAWGAAAGVIWSEEDQKRIIQSREPEFILTRWNDIEGVLSRGVILLEYKNITLVITWRMDYINCL